MSGTTTASSKALGVPVVDDTGIIDVDIHPSPPPGALDPYLSQRWRRHLSEYGRRTKDAIQSGNETPPLFGGMRADAYPPSGGAPGSDLGFLKEQLLDPFNVQLGVVEVLDNYPRVLNVDLGTALVRAVNDWQLEHLVYPEPRLRAAMLVQRDEPERAVAEIKRVGDDPGVVSVLFPSHASEPFGNRKYWPIYEAAAERGLPIQCHVGQGGGRPDTPSGWSTYYTQSHSAYAQIYQAQLLSLITSGVFIEFPKLKIILTEGGVLHFAPLLQRLDHHWKTLGSEVPHVNRLPSDYIRDHVWVTTQPIEEPSENRFLVEMMREWGEDNILFSSDYPHWDFDSPVDSLPPSLPGALREKLFRENGRRVFNLPGGSNG